MDTKQIKMKLMNDLKDCMSKTKYQKCKETIELGKYDTILFSLKECGKLINRLLTKNIIQQKHIENLQSELFISNDQLQSERIIIGQMYQQNIEKILYLCDLLLIERNPFDLMSQHGQIIQYQV